MCVLREVGAIIMQYFSWKTVRLSRYIEKYIWCLLQSISLIKIFFLVSTDGLRIQGQIASGTDLQALNVGMDMEVVLEKLYDDDEGNEVLAWKFRPV